MIWCFSFLFPALLVSQAPPAAGVGDIEGFVVAVRPAVGSESPGYLGEVIVDYGGPNVEGYHAVVQVTSGTRIYVQCYPAQPRISLQELKRGMSVRGEFIGPVRPANPLQGTAAWIEVREPGLCPPEVGRQGPPPDEPIRVGSNVLASKLKKYVPPEFPPGTPEGEVILQVEVDETGRVQDVKVIMGPPQAVAAAVEAVKQWEYQPTYLEGRPVRVVGAVRIRVVPQAGVRL
ncbi:MAG: hypothetical protein Kow00109_06510 [Acidobacteriota bacterium]